MFYPLIAFFVAFLTAYSAEETIVSANHEGTTNHLDAGFAKYQPILDRMPFGPLPAGLNADGTPDPSQEPQTPEALPVDQQQLAKQVKMSCVNISPDGETMVGFSDLGAKPQRNYYLAVGDTQDGWTIVGADYDKEWAKLGKDGVEITIQLGKGLVSDEVSNPKKLPAQADATPAAQPMVLSSPARRLGGLRTTRLRPSALRGTTTDTPAAATTSAVTGQSYVERLRARKQKQSAEAAAREKANQERLLKMAREAAQAEMARQREEDAEQQQQQPAEEQPAE